MDELLQLVQVFAKPVMQASIGDLVGDFVDEVEVVEALIQPLPVRLVPPVARHGLLMLRWLPGACLLRVDVIHACAPLKWWHSFTGSFQGANPLKKAEFLPASMPPLRDITKSPEPKLARETCKKIRSGRLNSRCSSRKVADNGMIGRDRRMWLRKKIVEFFYAERLLERLKTVILRKHGIGP